MCGRAACQLNPDEICKACILKKGNGIIEPKWQDHPGTHNYSTSTNIAPSSFCPVIVRSDGLKMKGQKRTLEDEKKHEYVIQPMMWGLIPTFHKGDQPNSHGYTTNNCRIEELETKNLYKPSLRNGQRCVILFDGFYEWKSTKGSKKKQPYFIHAKQPEGVEIWNKETWENKSKDADTESNSRNLLKMAGFYSKWVSSSGEHFNSFSVLTMEAGKSFSWLHHRIPAILETTEDIEKWLDSDNLDYKSLLSNFNKDPELISYPVSSQVNNSRNKDTSLMNPVSLEDLNKPPETRESNFMSAWLKKDKKSE